jgi:hypothetical protein
MRGLLVSILILAAVTIIGIPQVMAYPNCTEQIPELF